MHINGSIAALVLTTLSSLSSGGAHAATFYVAPLGTTQSCKADGSQVCPWLSIGAAFGSGLVRGGDVINLLDGDYGAMKLTYLSFDTPVTIQALNANKARAETIMVGDGTRNITIRNLNVWPSNPYQWVGTLVYTTEASSFITFDGLDARAGQDAASYPNWTQAEWLSRGVDGVMISGPNSSIKNSRITGTRFALGLLAADGLAQNNVIDGFSGDGLRGQGNNSRFLNNRVSNCVSVDDNHADGFQSFTSPDHPISGLVLDGNTIIEWSNPAQSPLRCSLQGIGMFDGWYDNLTIRNNVVAGRMGHGIAVYGTRHAVIANNTVVNVFGTASPYPWIMVQPLKNGTPSSDVVVANNLAMSYGGASDPANRISYVSNSVVMNPATAFQDVANFNYVPQSTSGFIDVADPAYAPATDILGGQRPFGAGPDRGAYEVGATGGGTTNGTPKTPGAGIVKWGKFLKAPKG